MSNLSYTLPVVAGVSGVGSSHTHLSYTVYGFANQCRDVPCSKIVHEGLLHNRALTMQDHVLDSVHHSDVASLVDGSQVASAEPAIREGLLACMGQLPVALKDSGPSALDLTHLGGARLQGAALWTHQAHIQQAEGPPRCAHQVQLLLFTATKYMHETLASKDMPSELPDSRQLQVCRLMSAGVEHLPLQLCRKDQHSQFSIHSVG